MRHTIPGQRLVALCVLGWLLFNYPLLALFDRTAGVAGIPLLYAYLFAAWALLILLLALAIERGTPPGNQEPPSPDALKD